MKLTDSQLTRSIYSLWDFQQALSALAFLLEDCDYERKYTPVDLRRFRCYETTCIVSLARPFQQSRSGTTLSLRAIGIALSPEESALLDRILELRRKVVAHSDEDEMHFVASSFLVADDTVRFPQVQFEERLEFERNEVLSIEALLRKLIAGVGKLIFDVAQHEPERLEARRVPARLGK